MKKSLEHFYSFLKWLNLFCITLQIFREILFANFFSGTFEDKEITHVEGEVDPVRDLDIINEELRLKDEESFLKVFDDLEKKYTRGEKKLKVEYVRFIT